MLKFIGASEDKSVTDKKTKRYTNVMQRTEIGEHHMEIACHLLPLLHTNTSRWQHSGKNRNDRDGRGKITKMMNT